MSFRLIVTSPDGSESSTTVYPLPTRGDAAIQAVLVFASVQAADSPPGVWVGEARALHVAVLIAALGELVTHPDGYSFRTEEF